MGVPGLWDIVKKQNEDQLGVNIDALRGKTLTIDVSGWIIELQGVADVPNMHIRNMFFRVIGLLNAGVKLIAVFDGKAPELKYDAMKKRQQKGPTNLDRRVLKEKSEECAEMLQCLGIPCMESPGEAEALCAYLEMEGKAHGCLTADSDYFCYGGRTVYRNLSKKGKSFLVDIYNADQLDLHHDDFIALAMLMGCDYDMKGVEGVGRDKSLNLIRDLKAKGHAVLDRITGWRNSEELCNIKRHIESEIKYTSHCTPCKHLGTKKMHDSEGCRNCRTQEGCEVGSMERCKCPWHEQQKLKEDYKLELSVREKALGKDNFPNDELVLEFKLSEGFRKDIPDIPPCSNIRMEDLIECLKKYLDFSRKKTVDYMIPVIVMQELRNSVEPTDALFKPVSIIKRCIENHVECYLIEWEKTDLNKWAEPTSTQLKIDRKCFDHVHPAMVQRFEDEQTPKKGKKRTRSSEKTKKVSNDTQVFKPENLRESSAKRKLFQE